METKKLYKSTTEKKIAGVCGGLAEYLDVDVTMLRLIWAMIVVFSGFVPGGLVYIIAAVVMPEKPSDSPISSEAKT
jgi:phage shock protein PspC (stress-responsive transcriptional regulator)